MVNATPMYHIIPTAQAVAQNHVTPVFKLYILLALLPVIVLLPVVTATIQLQKFIPEQLMVLVAAKQRVTMVEQLVQVLARQVTLAQHLQALNAHQVEQLHT